MSELISTLPEPAYLSRLALEAVPFGKLGKKEAYYSVSQSGSSKSLIQHLLRSTQQAILLQAAPGLGKTTLLEVLVAEQQTDLRFCLLTPQTDVQQLFAIISRSFAVNNEAFYSGESELEQLEQLLPHLQRLNIRPVLLVDDADFLSDKLLSAINQLLQKRHDGKLLIQAIFACAQPSAAILAQCSSLHTVSLEPLDEHEVKAYLMHRLQTVGYQGDCPFTDKDISTFFRQSKGNFAKLNKLAHQSLLREKAKKFSPSFKLPNFSFKLFQAIAGIVAVFVIVSILVFQDKINSWMSGADSEPIEQDKATFNVEDDVATVDIQQKMDVTSESIQQNPRQELANLLAELESEPVASEPQLQSVPSQADDVDSIESSMPIVIETDKPNVFEQKWILEQKATHYTYQLKGAWTEQEIDDYIMQYHLSGEAAKFTSIRNGKPWHVLIYGVYDNKQAAIDASKAWPKPLNTLPTWLRRFDSVQQQIKDAGIKP